MLAFDCNSITLSAVGDISLGDSPKMIGIGVRNASTLHGGEHLFSNVVDTLRADLVFGNLEGVLSDIGFSARIFKKAQLRGQPHMAKILKNVGFNILNLANNHIMQYGPEPFYETCELLQQAGISLVGRKGNNGWQCEPLIIDVKGHKVGFLGYADPDIYGHEPLFAIIEEERILSDVKRLLVDVDKLIVSLHWGDEFVRTPSPPCRILGRTLIESGVHIILGHHPHVIQDIENYKTGWICYSLGNFVSDMVWNPIALEGLAVTFDLLAKEDALIRINQSSIDDYFIPHLRPVILKNIMTHVESDAVYVSNFSNYNDLVKKRVKENRNRGYAYLLKNFYKYSYFVLLQIIINPILGIFVNFRFCRKN